MSADRSLLVVGSYGSADEPTIHMCRFDETSGELDLVGAVSGIPNPSFVAVAPGGRHLYAVSETGRVSDGRPGSVHAFRIDEPSSSVDLVPVNHRPSGGDHPCHLRIDPTGRWLAVANYGTGNVAVLPIRPDGALGEPTDVVRHEGAGPNAARQEGPHAHATIFAPDGRFLVAADLGIDRLLVSAFDPSAGSLQTHNEVAMRPGAGPRHLAFHPSGSRLFVVNELDNTLTVLAWDGAAGACVELVTVPTLPVGAPDSIAADVRVADDGRHVYVSNRGHDSVAVFGFDDRQLTRLAVQPCGGAWPRGLRVAPGGKHLIVANEHSDEIVVLPLVDGGGGLAGPVARLAISRPTCVDVVSEVE